ncbi:Isochorismatase-like protein [Desarmillaria tabescens]|uniref:nicotinamidase n=1 Tax=Armillaria tabescens TaxID=1929756 RepID=A0AA39J0G3_ARMTA|nr:Isochorismatase-like protein [Desarmillaria tabescens]KAK0433061.1 Isochorismatase-like protein [Desarmillaria tabescens]
MTTSRPQNFKPGLLIIDMQNDFCPPDGSLAVTDGRSIIPIIKKLATLPAFVSKVATKDFHPPNHVSFASNHTAPNNVPFTSFATITNPYNPSESYQTRLWPDHCVQGTVGSELVEGMDPAANNIDAIAVWRLYSAFYDPFTSPRICDSGLSDFLKKSGVNWVYVVGLALDYCVRASALDARKEGFEVVLVRDGTKAVDGSEENVHKVEEELRQAGIRVVDMASPEVQWLSTSS